VVNLLLILPVLQHRSESATCTEQQQLQVRQSIGWQCRSSGRHRERTCGLTAVSEWLQLLLFLVARFAKTESFLWCV